MNKKNVNHKRVFLYIFSFLSLMLLFLPFLVGFNDILTKMVQDNFFYLWIQKNIVPTEIRMMGTILILFGYKFSYSLSGFVVVNNVPMEVTWNCIGWQSTVLFLVTAAVGFGKKYKFSSVLTAVGIGILGTFWINIARMIFTIILAVNEPEIFRIVFHNYLAAFVTIIWLTFFWWFSYRFVLEEKRSRLE